MSRLLAPLTTAGACAVFLATAAPATAGDPARGRDLYGQRCGECHSESVHGRANRVARNFDEIRAWVERWNSTLALGWGAAEVEDVSLYLNDTYYHFVLPERTAMRPTPNPAAHIPAAR